MEGGRKKRWKERRKGREGVRVRREGNNKEKREGGSETREE